MLLFSPEVVIRALRCLQDLDLLSFSGKFAEIATEERLQDLTW